MSGDEEIWRGASSCAGSPGCVLEFVSERRRKVLIASWGGVPPLVTLVRDGNDAQKEKAAGALWSVSANNADNKLLIASCGGVPPLVTLVRDGTDAQKEKAAGALWNLAYQCTAAAACIAEMGGIEPLVRLVVNGTQEQKLWAAGILGYLDPDPETKSIVVANGGITVLIEFIRDSSDDGDKVEVLVALQNLCRGNDDMVRASLAAADRIVFLSEIVLSNNEKVKWLASCILSGVLGGATEAS
jgi:hypothetical protein